MALYGGIQIPGAPDLENIRHLDLLPIPMIRRMSRLGIAIDIPYFNDLTSELSREMADLRDEIACEIPPDKLDMFCAIADADESAELESHPDNWSPINVESGPQLAKLMFDVLGIGRGKDLKRTNSGDRLSTGKKQLEMLKKDHPVIGLVLAYRERSKLKNTYTTKLPKIARLHPRSRCCPICELPHAAPTFRIHTDFPTTRAATGRIASRNPNLQNIPARTLLGRKVRAGFIASPGTLLVSRDFSQIELRLLAHCANEANFIEIFRLGLDPHLQTAMRAFNITDPAKVDKLSQRAPCKNVNFMIVYGATPPGLYDQMAVTYATAGIALPDWLTLTWCEQFMHNWLYVLYPSVPPYMDGEFYRARRYGCVWDMFGRTRRVPEVQSALKWIVSAGLRQAGNLRIQSNGAGLMKLAMAESNDELELVLKSGVWSWPLLTIHDELIIEVEEDYADSICDLIGTIMDAVMVDKQSGINQCRVPILSDGHPMPRWIKE